jgi:hypothetical protein
MTIETIEVEATQMSSWEDETQEFMGTSILGKHGDE